ncbi:MAG: peptidyl-tRNA hydrolase [Elusimicrobiota bacterium]|jgi:peptidyl-tRNA hydrolase|nr:peptidyl-tRNA hydrolase [Elusimicrobiota bacterium]
MADHYEVKQVIVLRSDLNYGSKGKMIAMGCHASLGPIMKLLQRDIHYDNPTNISYFDIWCKGSFAKIVCKAENIEKIYDLQKECEKRFIPYSIITDNGTTVFGVPTVVGIGIGPYASDKLNEFTGDLKLL